MLGRMTAEAFMLASNILPSFRFEILSHVHKAVLLSYSKALARQLDLWVI